jgi:hypothetical protein
MPPYWAPCLKAQVQQRGVCVIEAEEVIYPDVQILLPGFVSAEQKKQWLAQEWMSNSYRFLHIPRVDDHTGEYVLTLSSRGQNWVFCNTRYTDDPYPDNWARLVSDNWAGAVHDNHCMGAHNRIYQFTEQRPAADDLLHDSLAVYNTPQGYSFQHFTDHTPKAIMQSEELVDQQTDILAIKTGAPLPSVHELWGLFPHLNASRIIFGSGQNHWAKVRGPGMLSGIIMRYRLRNIQNIEMCIQSHTLNVLLTSNITTYKKP